MPRGTSFPLRNIQLTALSWQRWFWTTTEPIHHEQMMEFTLTV